VSTSTHALSASYYADQAVWCSAEIVAHERLAQDTFRLRFSAPLIASRIVPGQFLMLRLAGFDDPLLGRALALFDVATNDAGELTDVEVVYMVVGKMTRRLTAFQSGQRLEVWGPLGNGFPNAEASHLIMVAGGVGITPFLAVAKRHLGIAAYGAQGEGSQQPRDSSSTRIENRKVTLCYGARTEGYFAALDQFEQAGIDVRLATDDGSRGHHGRVPEVLSQVILESSSSSSQPPTSNLQSQVYCCGPEPMMEAVAEVCRARNVPCRVSLETPMACGVGICFSCVTKVLQPDGEWDYKRTCVEGPVFDAEKIVWH
jgi:dihydroorotate dehydrogenase electron transfer subunit